MCQAIKYHEIGLSAVRLCKIINRAFLQSYNPDFTYQAEDTSHFLLKTKSIPKPESKTQRKCQKPPKFSVEAANIFDYYESSSYIFFSVFRKIVTMAFKSSPCSTCNLGRKRRNQILFIRRRHK